jgi:protein-tyrosine phosphatase
MGSWSAATSGLVVLPDGRRIRGRGLRQGPPTGDEPPELGVYLTGRRYEAAEWTSIWVRWPDFRLPTHRAEAVEVLRHVHRLAADHRVEIACGGGVGRTGAAIAVLARLAGLPAAEAVAWTRAHYRADAIETPGQRRYVLGVELG